MGAPTLRNYQKHANDTFRKYERVWRTDVCIQSPTGSGKSVMMADLLSDPTPQLVLTNRRLLLEQLARVLEAHDVQFGFRAAGYPTAPLLPVQLAMSPTEYQRALDKRVWQLHPCTRVHVDEIHGLSRGRALEIIQAYKARGASIVGWTATPREIGHICRHLLVAATVPGLIRAGYLVPPVVYTPDGPDCRRLQKVKRMANGEYGPTDLGTVWKPKVIIGRVEKYLRILNPSLKPTVLFAPDVDSSLWFAQHLSARSVCAAHVDAKRIWCGGETIPATPQNRSALFAQVRGGTVKVVCNRFVLREGWDQPEIEHVILACVFGTRTSYMQACGRGLRPAEGKTRCVFQDHGGNAWRFPLLDDAEPWDMGAGEIHQQRRRENDMGAGDIPEPIVCSKCHCTRVAGPECPECGFMSSARSRMVVQLDGKLRRMTGRMFPKKKKPREYSSDLERAWVGAFWAARKHRPDRTLTQVLNNVRRLHKWVELPDDLAWMPHDHAQDLWQQPAGDVDLDQLRKPETSLT